MRGHETSPCRRPRLLSVAIIACREAAYTPPGLPRENLIRAGEGAEGDGGTGPAPDKQKRTRLEAGFLSLAV